MERRERKACARSETLKIKEKWSWWQEAMVPNEIGRKDPMKYSRRTEQSDYKTHYFNKKTLEILYQNCSNKHCCGIYELKVVKNGQRAVVYVGSTCRGEGKSLGKRIWEYMTHGSHKRESIQNALDKGFSVWVRWLKISEDIFPLSPEKRRELVLQLEDNCLCKFDYAWNKTKNNRRRKIFHIDV